ncbi:MAG: Holliday junction branch migration protein RuvA [Anaerovoracaceae bacterium]|jgi:Holliday junction DNA helicase RuvA
MIHYILGTIEEKLEDRVIVECGGIGYEVFVPTGSTFYLAGPGETVRVYTHMMVKEDDVSLYGFSSEAGLDLFRKLITVSGVGAKAAVAILSAAPEEEIRKAIIYEDAETITRAKGVGKKMAQKIVLELKDKLGDEGLGEALAAAAGAGAQSSDQRIEAMDALIALGYSKIEASEALAKIKDEDLSAEEYIKLALKEI